MCLCLFWQRERPRSDLSLEGRRGGVQSHVDSAGSLSSHAALVRAPAESPAADDFRVTYPYSLSECVY